jgi:sigma-E factor negative regulatory protein RseC
MLIKTDKKLFSVLSIVITLTLLFLKRKMKHSDSPVIHHEGVVKHNSGRSVTVSISATSACSGCHAKGSCNMLGAEEKIINIEGIYNVSQGDIVTVLMEQSMGYSALLLGYILPFILLLTSLFTFISLRLTELTSGVLSLAVLVAYYSVLYIFRKKVNEKFTFMLKV